MGTTGASLCLAVCGAAYVLGSAPCLLFIRFLRVNLCFLCCPSVSFPSTLPSSHCTQRRVSIPSHPGVAPSLLTTFGSSSEPIPAELPSPPLPSLPGALCTGSTNAFCPYFSSLMAVQSVSAPPRPFSVLLHLLPLHTVCISDSFDVSAARQGSPTCSLPVLPPGDGLLGIPGFFREHKAPNAVSRMHLLPSLLQRALVAAASHSSSFYL